MSREEISELDVPPHFTNIQHGMQMARQFLALQDTPNRQVILITDGLPTAHFEQNDLYMLYPPDPKTESATMREGMLCKRDDITINIFLSARAGRSLTKTSSSLTASPKARAVESSSPPATTSTATSSGTTSTTAAKYFDREPRSGRWRGLREDVEHFRRHAAPLSLAGKVAVASSRSCSAWKHVSSHLLSYRPTEISHDRLLIHARRASE